MTDRPGAHNAQVRRAGRNLRQQLGRRRCAAAQLLRPRMGFDALEIPLLRSAPFDYAAVRTVAQANGVELVVAQPCPQAALR